METIWISARMRGHREVGCNSLNTAMARIMRCWKPDALEERSRGVLHLHNSRNTIGHVVASVFLVRLRLKNDDERYRYLLREESRHF